MQTNWWYGSDNFWIKFEEATTYKWYNAFFQIGIYSMQGWTTTMMHGIT